MFSGQAQNTNQQQIVGAIYSYDSNGGGAGFRLVYNTDPANPGGAPANQVVSQGTLPTPIGQESADLPSGSLPANITRDEPKGDVRSDNNTRNVYQVPITTSNGNLIPQ